MMLIYGYSLPHKFQFVNAKLINKMNLYVSNGSQAIALIISYTFNINKYINWMVGINGLSLRLPLCVREAVAAATDEIEVMVLSV